MRRLVRLIGEIRPEWQIVGKADSVETGIDLLAQEDFDLILTDIQLSDGTCFDILHQTDSRKPVIFLTAYDQYVLKAFDFNSIHYLVKPIVPDLLNAAFSKFERHRLYTGSDVQELIQGNPEGYAGRLLSKVGNSTRIIPIDDIVFVHHQDRMTKVYTADGKGHLVDHSVDHLENYLPSEAFFRISRNGMVNRSAVESWYPESSNRIGLNTQPKPSFPLVVSKDKTPQFKAWISA
ncbi:MAG: response regulator transcription factor [Bacteroidetes bacterium]|nr:response regulator transcription factor [Bacteroidota bacterium]